MTLEHLQMDEKTVDQLAESVRSSFASSADTACRNLAELLLHSIELRDLSKEAHEPEFWYKDKESDIKVEEMKNLRMNDILFFKDASFKKSSLQLFEKVGRECPPESFDEKGAIENFLDYLIFFTNSKLREFRNVSTQYAIAFFTGMLKNLHSSVSEMKKESKPKIKQSVTNIIKIASKFYYELFLKTRADDVDVHITSSIVDHLMISYAEGLALSVDEAVFLVTHKQADRTVNDLSIVKEGPMTRLSLNLILRGLRSTSVDRVSRFLYIVPKVIGEIAAGEGAIAKWEVKSKENAERNVARLGLEMPYLLKTMVEQKDEVGANILRFFTKARFNELCRDLISAPDEKVIFFMINSAKSKTKEAALEYIEKTIQTVATGDGHNSQRTRVSKLAHILYIIQHYKDVEIPGNFGGMYTFDQKRVMDLLNPFIPAICRWFDASLVATMFLEDAKNRELDLVNHEDSRAYIGCILLNILQSVKLIEDDKMPSSKLTDELKGESLENIKASCVNSKTQIKESVRKNLTLRYSEDVSSFRVHLRLIMVCYPDYDQHLQTILLDVFSRSNDHMLLREIAFFFRTIAIQQEKSSAISSGIFIEQVQKVFDDQIEVMNKLVGKWKKAIQEEEPHLLRVVLEKIEEDLTAPLRKLSTLKMSIPYGLRLSKDSLDSIVFLLDITITDNQHNKDVVEYCLRLVHEHLKYLMKNLLSNRSLQDEFTKWRDTCLEYFVFFIDKRSNPKMSNADALEVRRLAFPFLIENLQMVSHDKLVGLQSTYRRPDDQVFKLIWNFLEDYLFTSDEAHIQEPGEALNRSTGEKQDFGTLDVERSPLQDSGAKDTSRIQGGAVYLRCKGFRFIEDAATIVTITFRFCHHLFRTIGLNLAQCMVLKLLNLESPHQGIFLSKMDEFFTGLIKQEEESGNSQRLIFWKFIHSCFASYNFQTLKKLSKATFRFYSKHHNSDEAKRRYENFCIHSIQWATEQKDPENAERIISFIKKSLFEEQRFVRLLFFTQNMVDTLKEEFKDRDEELMKNEKYQAATILRDEIAKMCRMQVKDDERVSRRQSRSARRPSASKRKSRAFDEEKESGNPEAESKKSIIKIKGAKSKKTTKEKDGTKSKTFVDEREEGLDKKKSGNSRRESASRQESRSDSKGSSRGKQGRSQSSRSDSKNSKRGKSKQNKKGDGKKKDGLKKQKKKPSVSPEGRQGNKKTAKLDKGKGKK
jgi:putative NIF3 family GTP cyclohydrolase 1 type 2